jgi:hypothetical protein
MQRWMSAGYEREFAEMLETVAHGWRSTKRLVAFWPTCGRAYDGSLMVIGRATNGWGENDWTAEDLRESPRREVTVRAARAASELDNECPMSWVDKQAGPGDYYNTNRSAFWRVIRRIAEAVVEGQAGSRSVLGSIAWSNLYKVAPASGGNPPSSLMRLAGSRSARLIRREIEELQPRRVLALVGWSWFAEFAPQLALAVERRDGGPVEAVASAPGQRWVIAKHPERKPEDAAVTDIVAALGP